LGSGRPREAFERFADDFGLRANWQEQLDKEKAELERMQQAVERKKALLLRAQANAKTEGSKATVEKMLKAMDEEIAFVLVCKQDGMKKKLEVSAKTLSDITDIITNKFPNPPAGSEMQLKIKDKVIWDSSDTATVDDTVTVASLGVKPNDAVIIVWLLPEEDPEVADEDEGEPAEDEEEQQVKVKVTKRKGGITLKGVPVL
jgi:hypothetical protein